MKSEYEAIVAAGYILQVDSPDLGLGRHMTFQGLTEAQYVKICEGHVEALNAALAGVPRERARMHVCWGNYEGPHHHDAPFALVFALARRARVGALLFEAANPRHAHEWTWFADHRLADELVIAPGVIDSTTNFVEHPELVAQRIERFANLVGRESDRRNRLRLWHLRRRRGRGRRDRLGQAGCARRRRADRFAAPLGKAAAKTGESRPKRSPSRRR